MGKQKGKTTVAVGADKKDIKSRTDRAKTVGTMAQQSPIYVAQPTLQAKYSKLVAAGTGLEASDASVLSLESGLATARNTRDGALVTYDLAYDGYVAEAEQYVQKPEDVTALGLSVLARAKNGLAIPLNVEVKYDPVTGAIDVHVIMAAGTRVCLVEISTDPITATSWKRVPGVGVKRTLLGYAPGTYWIHAAAAAADVESAFTVPVSVIVK